MRSGSKSTRDDAQKCPLLANLTDAFSGSRARFQLDKALPMIMVPFYLDHYCANTLTVLTIICHSIQILRCAAMQTCSRLLTTP
jgi:hypothetical protein